MDNEKVKKEIDIVLNTWGVRSIDPSSLREALYKLVTKYNIVEVKIINAAQSDANRTRNRVKKRRSI
jgi:hypothetical protein